MNTKGIRILDNEDGVVSVDLTDILEEIPYGYFLDWSILFLEGTWNPNESLDSLPEKSLLVFEDLINKSPKGLFITWDEIKILAKKFHQIIDLVLIGCKDKNSLLRYNDDQDMYETCDYVIVMFDSSFWEVFSKDQDFIQRLAGKFKDIKFLESDFQKKHQ